MEEETIAKKKISFKHMIKISFFAFKMYIKPDKVSGIFLFIFQILLRLTAMVDFLIIAKIINVVVEILQKQGKISEVVPYVLILVGFSFVSSTISLVRWYLQIKMSQLFYYKSEVFLYEHYKNLGVPVMEDPDKNNLINRGMSEIHQIPALFFNFVATIADFINIIITGLAIFYFMPQMLLVMTIWVILRNIPSFYITKEAYKYEFKTTESRRLHREILNYILDKIKLIELTIHNATNYIKEKYNNFIDVYYKGWINIRKKSFFWTWSLDFLNVFIYFWVVINIINRIIIKKLSVGQLYFYISMVERFERHVNNMFSSITNLYEMALRIDDTYQFFNLKPSFSDGKIKLKGFKKPPKIICDNVSFKYPNTNKLILKNLNLEIKPGEKIAIVGHNGAGKTTLIKLLMRFYQVNNGNILINNDNIDDLKIDTYYRNVGMLSQDFGSYSELTAEDNIILGDPTKVVCKTDITSAAKKADAHKFISDYPKKYDQLLSESFNGGIRPSTGQWQKIAISRLFYRNPWLVIFDEPTASIDAEAEYKIFNNIYKFFKNKTVIIISHRFSTVRNADRIIVIDKGNIAEQGTHEELLKLNGKYAKAFKLQAEGYEIK